MEGEGEPGNFAPRDSARLDWNSPDSLRLLCQEARESGLLDGVELARPAAEGLDDRFLLTVRVADGVVLASVKFRWCDVRPPCGMASSETAGYVLERIRVIVQQTSAGFAEYTWLRVASELRQVRRLLEQSPRT